MIFKKNTGHIHKLSLNYNWLLRDKRDENLTRHCG
jgi:hypothetical protein